MPLDAVFLSALTEELRNEIFGAKIDKIYQPEKDELILAMRSKSGNVRLLISASPAGPRIHLTEVQKENPASPPMFCMLMRKHFTGARLIDLAQLPMERILRMRFDTVDEMGAKVEKSIYIELMGRNANIVAVDAQGRIIDCIRRVDGDMAVKRLLLPGLYYRTPPLQEKADPETCQEETVARILEKAAGDFPLDKWLPDHFGGISPLIGRELSYQSTGYIDTRLSALTPGTKESFTRQMGQYFDFLRNGQKTPVLLIAKDQPMDFTYMPIRQYGDYAQLETAQSFSGLLEAFYAERDGKARMKQKSQSLLKTVTNARDRIAKRVAVQQRELEAARDREGLRKSGDLIMANLHSVRQGDAMLRTCDYFDPGGGEIEIALNPLLTPQQNAAKYYKDYTKARNAEKYLEVQVEQGGAELEYILSVLDTIQRAGSERELIEIRQELAQTGYVKAAPSKKKMKQTAAPPHHFVSSSGFSILVGKNNHQNDLLTSKVADKSDIWLHTQKIHGSHAVILCEGKRPDEETITQAAILAALHSQARDARNVPVDYTIVKNVKKPNGAKPGMVVYDHYKTAYVDPDPNLAEALRIDGGKAVRI